MDESNKSEGERRSPAQQAQQPQPTTAMNDHQLQKAQMHSVSEKPRDVSENANKATAATPKEGRGGESKSDCPEVGAAPFDEARFNAGVVKLYEALLKEPIPEEMLRLVEQLGKQERK